jgi:hypothetical protein
MRGATERDKLQANQQIEVAYWEACVRSYQAFPQLRMINQPYCAACDTPMWLISIEPDRAGHDRRTFECPRCQEVTVKAINYRPEAA